MIKQWLTQQTQQQNSLYLMLDPLADPNPVATLLTNQAIKHYAWLLQNTPYERLQDKSPTLIALTDTTNQGVQELINHPEQNFGWFFSAAATITFENLTQHWHARTTLIYENQEVFYRFQDNRVLARALNTLPSNRYYQLLGQISHVALWDQDHWQTYTNPTPLAYPLTTKENLVWALPEPKHIAQQIRLNNLYDWLINTFDDAVFIQAHHITQGLETWLKEQWQLAEQWQWETPSQQHYLIEQKLVPEQAISPLWQPLENETPRDHYQRLQAVFNQTLPKKIHQPILDTDQLA